MGGILIIDDEKAIRDLYAALLEAEGFEVLQSENGKEGLAVAIQEDPELILLDYRLPDSSGLEILKMLGEKSTKEIPVLVITNYAGDVDEETVMQAGAKELLLKYEIVPSMLVEKIKQYIN